MNRSETAPHYGTVATAFAALQQRAAAAAARSLKPGPAPLIIGASKSQPASILEEAITAGLRQFGENKVQEAQSKWPRLKEAHPDITLHLIGSLQSNKAADTVALFDVIQTVDRIKIADAIANEMAKQNRTLQLLIQVNTGEEPQKGGVMPRDLPALIAHYEKERLPGLAGLMCVPPADVNPAPHFALLQKMAAEYQLPLLSMGMSSDYEIAVRFGATHVRIGTALFGARNQSSNA